MSLFIVSQPIAPVEGGSSLSNFTSRLQCNAVFCVYVYITDIEQPRQREHHLCLIQDIDMPQ
jgi:hypothetical protein